MVIKKTIPYIVIGVLIILLLLQRSCNKTSANDLVNKISTYKTLAKHYKGLNGVEIAQNKALMLENQDQIKSVLNENDTLKQMLQKFSKLKNVTIINNNTEIYNDSLGFDPNNIPCDFKPFKVRRDSSHYTFVGTIGKSYFKIDSLRIPDKQSIVFGKRKMGFLKKREYTAEVIHSNPLVNTTNIGQYSVQEKRKKIVIAIGGGAGTNLSSFGLKPMVGVFVGFPIISW